MRHSLGVVDGAWARNQLYEILGRTAGLPDLKVWVGHPEGAAAIWPDAIAIRPGADLSGISIDPELVSMAIALFVDKSDFQQAIATCRELFRRIPEGASIALWTTGWLTTDNDWLRREILAHGTPTWIIWLGALGGQALNGSAAIATTLTVFKSKAQHPGIKRPVKLVTLDALEGAGALALVQEVARREGGEGDGYIIWRGQSLGMEPWIFEGFSQERERNLADLAKLGELTKLEVLFHIIRPVAIERPTKLEEIPELGSSLPEGYVPCYRGEAITRDGVLAPPRVMARAGAFGDRANLRQGDLLVGDLFLLGKGLRVATVRTEDLPGIAHGSVYIIRPREDVQEAPALMKYLPHYLSSERASALLQTRVATLEGRGRLNARVLNDLAFPLPRPEVFQALEKIEADQVCHQDWALDLATRRMALFEAPSYREAVPDLLQVAKTSADRVQAAKEAGTLDFLVRERFPHPFSLRRQDILRTGHGEARIGKIRECAELLVTFLAYVGTADALFEKPRWSDFLAHEGKNSYNMTLGKARNLLHHHLSAYGSYPDPLLLAFPQFALLKDLNGGSGSAMNHALEEIHRERNDGSHGIHETEVGAEALSIELTTHLDTLLEGCSVLTDLQLVRVADYWMESADDSREAEFELCTGISPVFRVRRQAVPAELPKGKMGILTPSGIFRSLAPLLSMRPCGKCGRNEIFRFSKMGKDRVTLMSMEQGHKLELTDLKDCQQFIKFFHLA